MYKPGATAMLFSPSTTSATFTNLPPVVYTDTFEAFSVFTIISPLPPNTEKFSDVTSSIAVAAS